MLIQLSQDHGSHEYNQNSLPRVRLALWNSRKDLIMLTGFEPYNHWTIQALVDTSFGPYTP
ncbi:hypothetical protein [Acinetobacter larvae]|uniref:hypothetical protein n=1 Tax=Acinetobacter larvae TaxID=1789224 RepID=UPI0012FE63AE|nr:hypothetical protein [Acinetobacter larvae]